MCLCMKHDIGTGTCDFNIFFLSNVPLVLVAFVVVDDADYANGVDVSKCMNLEPFFPAAVPCK